MKPSRELQRAARILRALAHPNRLAIFARLQADGRCCRTDRVGNTVCAIADDFQLALSTVSHHLRELRLAGLITCERRGQRVVCTVNEAALARIAAVLAVTPPGRARRGAVRGAAGGARRS